MIKDESLSRLLNFSDAIVAVAITLLVIPLTDLFGNDMDLSLVTILNSKTTTTLFFNFVLSFLVIFSYWKLHHKIFTDVKSIEKKLSY